MELLLFIGQPTLLGIRGKYLYAKLKNITRSIPIMNTLAKKSLMRNIADYLQTAYEWANHHISEIAGTSTGIGVGITNAIETQSPFTVEHILQVALFGFIGGGAGFAAKELGSYIKSLFTKKPKK
jgi:hypothetical protein